MTLGRESGDASPSRWIVVVLAAFTPWLVILCRTLWRTPFPLSEAVALFEDVARTPPLRFLVPESAYYRPLFHLTLSALWRHAPSLDATLAGVKLLQIVPAVLLVTLAAGCSKSETAQAHAREGTPKAIQAEAVRQILADAGFASANTIGDLGELPRVTGGCIGGRE